MNARVSDIEMQMQSADFWTDHKKAGRLSKEVNELKEEVEFWDVFEARLEEFESKDDETLEKMKAEIGSFSKQFQAKYVKILLSGPHDTENAILHIFSGAGGDDAQDWARMLLEMYQGYCADNGFGFIVLDQSFGEQGGTKSVAIEISGARAYGYLKGESGVHRLVRISPFSSKSMRHTSFAMVEILPEISDKKLEIKDDDLRIDTFRSSGPGGQNVNKLETAVRITHIPTNTTVSVQSERSQAQNKEKAFTLLHSKLMKLMEEHSAKELEDLRGKIKDQKIEWGSQIRSYVLHPYKQVKDHRTGVEVSNVDSVLKGELREFIDAEILME